MSYLERQNVCGIQIGDEVEVLRTPRGGEGGWGNSWVHRMSDCVGNVYKVESINGTRGIGLHGTGWNFPFSVLGPEKGESDDPPCQGD